MMKKLLFASIAALGSALCATAASWWVKPGTVDWTSYDAYFNNDSKAEGEKSLPGEGDIIVLSGTAGNTYTLNASTDPDSLALVNKVAYIWPEYEGRILVVDVANKDEIALKAGVTDFGASGNASVKLVKTGTGTLLLENTTAKTSGITIYSYYTDIDVQGGTLKFPQGLSKCHFETKNVDVAEGAALWLMSIADVSESNGSYGFTTLRTLAGSGLVTNVAPVDRSRYLRIGKSCDFDGVLGGGISLHFAGTNVRFNLTGTNSTFSANGEAVALDREGVRVGLKKLMCDSVHGKSGTIDQPSSMGMDHQVRGYAKDVGIVYLGAGGESTWMGVNVQYSPFVIDAGATGGITFENGREWTGYYGSTNLRSEMQELVLTGSNTETVVFRPLFRRWTDLIAPEGSRTNCTFYITKRGTGTWYFGENANARWCGGLCVEEGTLQYDRMTEIGVNGPLGFGTMAQCRYAGPWDPASNVTYQIALGGSAATPRFEYLGSNIVNNTTRHIGLNTQGAIVATGCKRPKVYGATDKEHPVAAEAENPFGPARFMMRGVVSTGGTGEKTLVLDSATNSLPTIADISDGPYGGTVGVTKRGAGNALITGPLTFSGKIKVEEGTLYVNDGAHYRWFKFTPTLTRYADSSVGGNNYQTQFAELALYDKDGHRVNVGMAGEAYTETFGNWHAYGAGRDYTVLTPNQAALGRDAYKYDWVPLTYDSGARDSAGVIALVAMNSMVDIFDDKAANDANNTFSVYNRTAVKTTVPRSWLSVFMHVKNTAKEVSSYDFAFFRGQLATSPYDWKLEGSVNGLDWDLLDEQTNYRLESTSDTTSSYNYWSYTNATKTAVRVSAGQVRQGWPIANAPANAAVSDLSKVTLEVAAGASLVAEGDFTVARIEVDASGDGVGTIDNFQLAPTGTLTVRNLPKGGSASVLPLAFANVDPSALEDWSLTVDGKSRPAGSIRVSEDGKVSIIPLGMMLIVR